MESNMDRCLNCNKKIKDVPPGQNKELEHDAPVEEYIDGKDVIFCCFTCFELYGTKGLKP